MRFIIAAALLLTSSFAHGQQLTCKSSEACLKWFAPTQYEPECGSCTAKPIAVGTLITYRIYRQTNGIMTALANTTTGTQIKLINQPRGQQCYAVMAIIGGTESKLSNVGCKMIRFSGPTDGGIERPSDGGIERR